MRVTPLSPGSVTRSADFTSPLTVPGGEVAGSEIVRELPPELALTVWQTLRTVLLWAAEAPALRGGLFERGAMELWERELLEGTFDVDLRYPLAVIVGELAGPDTASAEQVAHACLCTAEWGLAHNATRTALAYTEAAALCRPDHPRYAWMAGRLLRRNGHLREAEQWIKRAVRVAGRIGDWETQTLSLNSLGNLFYEAGKYREAVRTLEDALRVARKHRLRAREGEILHDIFAVMAWVGDLTRAEPFAQAAFEIYRSGHHRLPALAHDVAVLWIRRNQFARAFAVLKELPVFFELPEERMRVLASLCRSAAACGDSAAFFQAFLEAEGLAGDERVAIQSAPALVQIGLGAWELDEWDVAERVLANAARIASRSGESDALLEAESALDAVRARSHHRPEQNPAPSRSATLGDTLVTGFLSSLQTAELTASGSFVVRV